MNRLQTVLRRSRSRGVSLITAVFLVVVLATLAAAMARLQIVQQSSNAMDMLGIQAYQAARSGLEWGIYQQLRVQPPSVACFASPQIFTMPSNGSLSAFTVKVSCTPKPGGNTAGDTTNRWTIVSTACNKPGASGCPTTTTDPEYVQRRVQAELN